MLSKFQLYVLTLNWRPSIVAIIPVIVSVVVAIVPVVVAIIPIIVSVVVAIVPVVVAIIPIIVSVVVAIVPVVVAIIPIIVSVVPIIPVVVAIIPVIVWNWSGLCHLRWCWWDWRRFWLWCRGWRRWNWSWRRLWLRRSRWLYHRSGRRCRRGMEVQRP